MQTLYFFSKDMSNMHLDFYIDKTGAKDTKKKGF
jgi:hypothetical protein